MRIGYNKNGDICESSIHLTVMEWVKLHPSISPYVLHFPNESKRSPRYGRLLKKMGMRKGVSDLFIAIPNKDYAGAWIEIKTMRGRITKEQTIFLDDMKEKGYFCSVTRGVKETMDTIKWYVSD